MNPNWRNISKVCVCILGITIFNGILMGLIKPPEEINVLWCVSSGALVGFFAVLRWEIF